MIRGDERLNKSESKYFNTAIRMDEALISLLEKKDFEFITVKEICEAAKVNRSTFYLHYENTTELLAEALEYYNSKFESCFQSEAVTIEKIKSGEMQDLVFITTEYLVPYLTFIKENQRFFLAALRKPEVYGSKAKYRKIYTCLFEPILERFEFPENERKFIASFYIQGIMGIITEWIQDECKEEIIDMCDLIERLIIGGGEGG